jgi:DNA-binding ferritin-like protein
MVSFANYSIFIKIQEDIHWNIQGENSFELLQNSEELQ